MGGVDFLVAARWCGHSLPSEQLCVVDNFRVVNSPYVPLKVVSVDKRVVDGLEQHFWPI